MAKNGILAAQEQQMKAQAVWEDLTRQARETIVLLFGLLITPLIVCVGAAYGIRAGIIVGMEKTLELFKAWTA